MKRYWSRRLEREVVVLVDAEFWGVIDGHVIKEWTKIRLPNIADSESKAEDIARRIVLWKQKKKSNRK